MLEFGGGGTRKSNHQQLLVLHIFEQKQRGKFVHQYASFATSRTGSHHYAARVLIADNLHLLGRECSKYLFIPLGREIATYFLLSITLKILCNKIFVVHFEVVLHILQSRIIVAHHNIGKFAHYVHLLYLLLIEVVEHAVILLLIAHFIILDAGNIHSVI